MGFNMKASHFFIGFFVLVFVGILMFDAYMQYQYTIHNIATPQLIIPTIPFGFMQLIVLLIGIFIIFGIIILLYRTFVK